MVKKSKLIAALDAQKGRDFRLEKQRKQEKQAKKRKIDSAAVEDSTDPGGSNTDSEDPSGLSLKDDEATFPLSDESDSESDEVEEEGSHSLLETRKPNLVPPMSGAKGLFVEDEGEDEEEDIAISEIESLASADREDIISHQRLTINNTAALLSAHKSLAKGSPSVPFSACQTRTTSAPVSIPDANDDLNRELAFYKQCLDAAIEARALLKEEGIPFTRPNDYFAEMVKSDEHMGKIKSKIVDDAASRKASSEAKRQRDLKKFGKQVQIATMQERAKEKRRMLERVDLLKKKRKGVDTGTTNEEDLFDVALDDAAQKERPTQQGRKNASAPPSKKQKKDAQFGFGGKKRFSKSGDAVSTGDMSRFSAKKMKGRKDKPKRLGKSRRARSS